ncbi:hydrogenase expression/formation protein HypE [Catenulispora subtropica]|uniref:Hydrogenase expression/formation protein HypE n=1 Tax=Catenulispora subtropica TaxID=450798 RepID=A0ABP5ENQ6_9ACTN
MTASPLSVSCPAPVAETEHVLLGHGSGGLLSAELLRDVILPAFGPAAEPDRPLEDAAVVRLPAAEVVMSTDSFVVDPLFFPGGDIGSLAVHGTVNDLAMMGAVPRALAVAFIVEEGFGLDELARVSRSLGRAADAAGVRVVTGDTKVVGRGAADRLFITTTGLGVRLPAARPSAGRVRPGDVLLLSGPIGLHGVTIMSTRSGLGFETEVGSDSQPLHHVVAAAVAAGGDAVHALRDPTRGGVASALNELAAASGAGVVVEETALPVPEPVAAACDLLGLDVLHVANEGCLLAFVAPERADAVLAAMRSCPESAGAVRIGRAVAEHPGRVVVRTGIGAERVLDMLVGEQLPRIC